MTFKANWEKTSTLHELPPGMIERMVILAYPHKKLRSYYIIPGGCANLNIKIKLDKEEHPLILRIYLRSPESAFFEQKLGNILNQTVPIPQIYYIGDLEGYRFAFTEFIPGITLRQLLLSNESHDMPHLMFSAGQMLAKINKHQLPGSYSTERDYLFLALNILKSIRAKLNEETILKIKELLTKNSPLFPHNSSYLVHYDFDPSNILVDKIQGTWQITGIIDWEFSSTGSFLWDIANMLRYAHQMPKGFQNSFLEGVEKEGLVLPRNLHKIVNCLNLMALIDLLHRTDPKRSPNQYDDIIKLINHIIEELKY